MVQHRFHSKTNYFNKEIICKMCERKFYVNGKAKRKYVLCSECGLNGKIASYRDRVKKNEK